MANIQLTTFVAAPVPRVFNLSRNISIYRKVFNAPNERFDFSGSDNHLSPGDSVSIQARHISRFRSISLKVTSFEQPWYYQEELIKGDLPFYKHEHHFKEIDNGSIMIDVITYGHPNDLIGKMLASFYMKTYIEKLANERNRLIKEYAESEKWRVLIS